ncbi:MAG: 50S ribosomal protein L4, partial [Candidatus Micrarchaeia archaeon]
MTKSVILMKAIVYGIDGTKAKEMELPSAFDVAVRDDLIRRAFLSEQSEEFQPKGAYRWAGLETSARYRGRKEAYHTLKNRGGAKLPRQMFPKGGIGNVRRIPSAVKGRRAHPPKPEKIIVERMNAKEKDKALASAIAATAKAELVKERGHVLGDVKLPIVFDDAIENIKKTKEAIKVLERFIGNDIRRAADGRKKRKGRLGGTKSPKSALIVVSGDVALKRSARSIPGVDVSQVDMLKVSDLAPGGNPGRLTIWTRKALDA